MSVDYQKEGKIAIFTINRPQALNSMDMQTVRQLHDAMVDFRDDPDLWVGIVTGAGDKAFSGGADMKDTFGFYREHLGAPWAVPDIPMRGLDIWKPLIAAINGFAIGGGMELALTCDLRIMSETARMGSPEVNIGVIAFWGGTQRLPRMIPRCLASEILLMGKLIDAQEAYRMGLVNKVVPQDKVMSTAKEWAEVLLQKGPLALRATKEAIIRGSSMPLEQGLELENSLNYQIFKTEDFEEGVSAYLAKRKPNFKAK